MRKTAIALTLTTALLITATATCVDLAKANPMWFYDFKDLQIMVSSPVSNMTYFSDSILLDFNVTKPREWFDGNFSFILNPPMMLHSVSYEMDGIVCGSFVVESNLSSPFMFSNNLTGLEDGVHTLQIKLNGTGDSADLNHPWLHHAIPMNDSSEIIYFAVDTTTQPEPFPTVPVAAVSTASISAVAAGLLLYRRKRKR